MTDFSTTMHTPGDSAPVVSNKVAYCSVCHTEFQVRGDGSTLPNGCPFCDAPKKAIRIKSEELGQGGAP